MMAWTKRTITKDGEPRYKTYWYDPSGSQRSKTFSKSEDARRFERTVEVDKDRGSYTDPNRGKITLGELAEKFMESRTAGEDGLRPSSAALYGMQLRRYIVPALGHRRLYAISKSDVSEFETGLRNAGTGAASVEAVHRLLHAIFAYGIEQERIVRNPATRTREERKTRKVRTRKPRFLDETEVEKIAAEVPERYRALVWTLAVTGLRIGEATALRVGSLDLKAGTIRVTVNAPEVNGHKLLDQPTKTERSVRTVDIPASLSAMLAEHLNQFGNRFDSSALVFTTDRGQPVLQSSFRKNVLTKAALRAGIDPVPRVHDLRHTAASFMGRAGYTLLEAAEQLGHSATAMTAHYSHVFPDSRQEKVARLDTLLGGTSG
jgi:integrase